MNNPDLFDEQGNPLTQADVIAFLNNELDPESDLYRRIQHDFVERRNGFVHRTLHRLSVEAIRNVDTHLDGIWNETLGKAGEDEGDEDDD